MTLGSVVGTLPAGWLARKIGLRPLLVDLLLIASPLLGVLRALGCGSRRRSAWRFWLGWRCASWGVCFLPAVARLTTEENRASAFSLIFSAGIGTSMLGRGGLRLSAAVAEDGRVCDAGGGGEAADSAGLLRHRRGRSDPCVAPAAAAPPDEQ